MKTIEIIKIYPSSPAPQMSREEALIYYSTGFRKRTKRIAETMHNFIQCTSPGKLFGYSENKITFNTCSERPVFVITLNYENKRHLDAEVDRMIRILKKAVREAEIAISQTIDMSPHNPAEIPACPGKPCQHGKCVNASYEAIKLLDRLRPVIGHGWYPDITLQMGDSRFHIEQHDPSPHLCGSPKILAARIIGMERGTCIIRHRRTVRCSYRPELKGELMSCALKAQAPWMTLTPSYLYEAGRHLERRGEIIAVHGIAHECMMPPPDELLLL